MDKEVCKSCGDELNESEVEKGKCQCEMCEADDWYDEVVRESKINQNR